MNTIYIRGISDDLLQDIDRLADKKKLSRNQLVLEILTDYMTLQDENLHKLLPKIVHGEVKEEIKTLTYSVKRSSNLIAIIMLRLARIADKFEHFFFPELEKIRIDDMNAEQILSIINTEYPNKEDENIEEFLDDDVDF